MRTVGFLAVSAQYASRGGHHVTEYGSSVLYIMYQRQIILKRTVKCHVTLKVRASQLVEIKWVKNQTINRAVNKENEVRA